MKILNMLCFHYDEQKERLYQNAQPFTGNRVFTFPNGDMFEGDFENGKPHGKGKMTFPNGDLFEGEFENGKPHGKGRMTFSNGNHLEGDFQNGGYVVNPNFNGQNTETDIVFPQPVEARYITFKPKYSMCT